MHAPLTSLQLTELSIAIKNNNIHLLHQLVDQGVDLNVVSPPNTTSPLSEAVATRNPTIVRFLLSSGAHPDGVKGELAAPMTIAALQGRVELLQTLVAAGASAEVREIHFGGFFFFSISLYF